MIKKYLLFFLILIAPICVFSQTTSQITITSEQLQTTNLIFAEHAKLRAEIPLLERKVANLERIDSLWQRTDSIRLIQISNYKDIITKKDKKIKQQKTISQIKNILIGGLAILCVFL